MIHLKANAYGHADPQLYETPELATLALIDVDPWLRTEGQPRLILEPACGPGAIAGVMGYAGHKVRASDLHYYGERWKGKAWTPRDPAWMMPEWHKDFFDWTPNAVRLWVGDSARYQGCTALVTNPPYGADEHRASRAEAFALHALELVPRVYMLLEATFFQAGGTRRAELFDRGHLTGFFPFADRLDMHRDGFPEEDKQTQSRRHAWFRWQRGAGCTRPEVRRLCAATGRGL